MTGPVAVDRDHRIDRRGSGVATPRQLPHGEPVPDRLVAPMLLLVERLRILAVYVRRSRRLVPYAEREALSGHAKDILDVARTLRRHALDERGGRMGKAPRVGPLTHREIEEGVERHRERAVHGLSRLRRRLEEAGCTEVVVFLAGAQRTMEAMTR